MRAASANELEAGVVTASAGNMAPGRRLGGARGGRARARDRSRGAPRAKLDRIEALGAELVPVTHEEWWRAMVDRGREGVDGFFVHPVADEAVMAGNGTIGLELAEDAPEFDAVVIPWGGGGLTTGIASAVKALRPDVRVVTAEPETGAPLAAALAAGEPRAIEFRRSWVDGAGGQALLPGMWDRARELVDEAATVPLAEVEEAVRILASRAHVVAEGAGALALAAALRRDDRCVCIVSGGNVDPDVLARSSVGQERHRPARVAAEQDRARDRRGAEAVSDRVDGGVDRLAGPRSSWRVRSSSSIATEQPISVMPRRSISGVAVARSARAVTRIACVLAVANGSVCERVARSKSPKRRRSTTVRPTRRAARRRRVIRSTIPTSVASTVSAECRPRPSARCEPIEPRRRPVSTRRKSRLWASALR